MAAVTPDGPDQFAVRFRELARRGLRTPESVQVDPFLVGRALLAVMQTCSFRTASGQSLVWNDYRVILARADFEPLRAFEGTLERDLRAAIAGEQARRNAQLAGELCVTLVADEANELEPGRAVIRVAFTRTERPDTGTMTVRFDTRAVAGEIDAAMPPALAESTVFVAEPETGLVARWAAGTAPLPAGVPTILGRPHPGAPRGFIGLTGASARISKQHLVVTASGSHLRIERPASANPVQVNGQTLAPGASVDAGVPVEISLSRGDLVVVFGRGG